MAKGLVKYQWEWITLEEKFELEQEAKGLVKYQGTWVTPEKKFELEQMAKGLVKYQGEWITPEEKFELEQMAKGLIKYEGGWLTYAQVQEAYEDNWMPPKVKWGSIFLKFVYDHPISLILIPFIALLLYKRRYLIKHLMLNKNKKQKIIILIICVSFSVVGISFVLTKVGEYAYENKSRSVAATIIVSEEVASGILAGVSDVWDRAIGGDFNYRIIEYLYSQPSYLISLAKSKVELKKGMSYLKNYPMKYKEAFNILMELYGIYSQISELAVNPSGSLISFNNKVNDLKSEFTKIKSELMIYLPNFDPAKEWIKEQSNKLKEQVSKLFNILKAEE